MKRKLFLLAAAVCIAAVMCAAFAACADKNWNDGSYDLSLPDFEKITANSGVSEDGWYLVFEDDFDKGVRKTERRRHLDYFAGGRALGEQ